MCQIVDGWANIDRLLIYKIHSLKQGRQSRWAGGWYCPPILCHIPYFNRGKGHIMPRTLLLAPPGFSDLPTTLHSKGLPAFKLTPWRIFFKAHILTLWIDSVKFMEIYGKFSSQNKHCIPIIKKYLKYRLFEILAQYSKASYGRGGFRHRRSPSCE